MRVIALFVLTFLIATCAVAQPVVEWSRAYASVGNDYCFSLLGLPDGGYAMAGVAGFNRLGDHGQFCLLRTMGNGDSLWCREYGTNDADICLSMRMTSDGGFVLGGYTMQLSPPAYQMMIMRLAPNGDSLWCRTYSPAGNDSNTNSFCTAIREAWGGGFIIAGELSVMGANDWNRSGWIIRTNAFGDTLWTRSYGGIRSDEFRSIQQTSDGGYILAGYTDSYGSGHDDVWLMKITMNGDSVWSRTFGDRGDDEAWAVLQTPDGGYALLGTITVAPDSLSNTDLWLIRTNSNGDSLWSRRIGGADNDYGYSLQQTPDGGFVVAGHGSLTQFSTSSYLVAKVSAIGEVVWAGEYEGAGSEMDGDILQTADGGYILAGSTSTENSSGEDFHLIKLSRDLEANTRAAAGNFSLLSCYPNPFNGSTTLSFSAPRTTSLTLRAFDVLGREVATIAEGKYVPGQHTVRWDCPDCASGVYLISLSGEGLQQTQKVMLLK